ncbi:MAG: PEP-CTERM sorting domain-containing protein [Phycisphaerales bacterium]|nr:PEP-CTERM sorting domain-containing protein [Phycisphaerales bacterium]
MLLRRLLCVLVVFVGIGVAQAATTPLYTDTKNLPNETVVTLNLPKFDASSISVGPGQWVELTGVLVDFEVRLSDARVQLDNDSEYAQGGTAYVINTPQSFASSVTLLKTDFSTINLGDFGITSSEDFDLDPTTGDAVGQFNATGLGDYANWEPGTITAGNGGNISNLVWGNYLGTGDFQVSINALYLTSATFKGELGYFEGNTPTGTFYGAVQYSYVIVPEPMTLSLVGLGALALFRKRRSV